MKGDKSRGRLEIRRAKLEYFAGEALRGLLANPNPNISSEMVVEMAMVYAEEMINKLEKIDKDEENVRRIQGSYPKKNDR